MRRLLVLAAALALVAVLAGCRGDDDAGVTSTGPPSSSAAPASTTAGRVPQGFTAVTATVTAPDGSERGVCLLLATSREDRGRGLMQVDSLGGYDGMLFRFGEPTEGAFYMFQTVLPLSIAWFDGEALVGTADMAPCPATDAAACPLYSPGAAYTDAVEVPQGGLGAVGIAEGSRLAATDEPCAPSSG